MEHQCEQLQSSEYETPTNSQQKSFVPPPPPPPLPNFQLTPVNTPLKFENKKFISQPIRNGLPSGKELLKDLKKVQLRKIDKSPGGGPLKKPKQINDPGDFLEAVLKRRFGLIQNSPDSSLESVSIEANNSFNSVSHCANYSDGRNFKSTVY